MATRKTRTGEWKFLRPADVPEHTHGAITERQVRRWIDERRLPFYKPSGPHGPVMIHADDLAEFIRASRVSG